MTRERIAQGGPPARPALRRFPRYALATSKRLWRMHRRGSNPWYFSNSRSGRFDLGEPYGTCYVATSDVLAVVEVLGPEFIGRVVPETFFRERMLTTIRSPNAVPLANTCVARAYGFGVTGELASMVPYTVPQQWAEAFHAAGFAGVRYRSRLLPGVVGFNFALFGRAGTRRTPKRWSSDEPGTALYRRLRTRCGILVGTPPPVSSLSVS